MASLDFTPDISPEETYSLYGKQIKFNAAADIAPYLEELLKVKPLKKVDFSGNTIGIEASKSLAEALVKNGSEIEEINFSDLYTGRLNTEIPQSLEFLLPALLKLPKLSILNLSDNAFGLQTIEPIEKFLPNAVELEHLILSNNGMGPFAGGRIGKALYKLAENKKTAGKKRYLKTFICGRNRLENGSIQFLALGLKNNSHLETIKLYQNGIRPKGIEKLVTKALVDLKDLKIIDLQDNTVTKRSAVHLADGLAQWPQLKELNLNDAMLQKQGGQTLLTALLEGKIRENLKILKLQFNELDEASVKLVAESIEKNLPNLQELELNGNIIDEESKYLASINAIFEERGFGRLDELDELEEPDSDMDDDDEEDEDEEEEDELDTETVKKLLHDDLAKDKDEDVLIEKLNATHIV